MAHKKRGIVLIAGGHPYYGNMARNLAMGIKLYSPDIEIALFHDVKAITHFTDTDKQLFTLYELPDYTYKSDKGTSFLRAKTFLYELSPFSETIFFDVDLVWHKDRNIEKLFEELSATDFTMINEGYLDLKSGENLISKNYHFWVKTDNIKSAYPETIGERLYQYRSEFIYFKKNAANKKYFSKARLIYDTLRCESVMFGSVLPDETAFTIASALLKHYPHKSEWSPVYWDYLYSFLRLDRPDVLQRYYASSMGGRQARRVQVELYNDLVRYYHSQYKTPVNHLWINKIDFDKERTKI